MIELLLMRLAKSKEINQIVVATSVDKRNRFLVEHVQSLGFACEQGSESDVLERYVQAAEAHKADVVVRITGDCPLADPALVDHCIREFHKQNVHYLSNTSPPTFPDGLDIEVMRFSVLEQALHQTEKSFDREHVTPYIRGSSDFLKAAVLHNEDLSALRWTVDDPEDFEVINNVFKHFSPNIHFGWEDVLALQKSQPDLFAANRKIERNMGAMMNTGQKLWQRAKRVIPGGNMLLSKRAEMFLPDQWPTYFSQAKGCKVWDLDGKEYTDMSIMGIGTNTLGYGHPEVDEAVMRVVQAGNMSTFNCPEEVYLAEKMVELHPWADMARFARSGGEANAIAIRIARAASGRDKVAVCGYHGWHDWYLSANLGDDKSLDGHLLPGLEPNGVPRNLRGTVFPFNYNQLDELEDLVNTHDIGVIKMEVVRNMGPESDFLHDVRKLATERGIVLIFDECTSGFRETFGGLHKKYGVEPDMAMFGKALGNGYAITATIGRGEVMQATQSTFISSTFWTERIGPSAALKTLEVMEYEKSWEVITNTGLKIRDRWQKLADEHGLAISHWGLPALAGFSIQSDHALAYKTLITQEMLGKGYLAGNSVYVCTEHTPEVVDGYFDALDPVFRLIGECEQGRDVEKLLRGPVCHGGFKRLN
jgi:glutamate-1-semialdehyde 2,1-aminomutase